MQMSKIRFLFFLTLVLFIQGCDTSKLEEVRTITNQIDSDFVPDSRVALFDVDISSQSSSVLLTGETNLPDAKEALFKTLDEQNISYIDSIEVLPSSSLNEMTFALVNNSAANLRSEPRHSAQLATQAIMGMPLKVLKKSGGWYLVQAPDDYLSWVDGGGIERMNKEQYLDWVNAPKLIYLNTVGFAYSNANSNSEKVSDLVAGSILKVTESSGIYHKVEYPDGRNAYVKKSESQLLIDWEEKLVANQESLTKTAKTLIGAPYLWGGTSTKGMDCSGFTKTIYFMNGQIIPRDASQQVKAGTLIDADKNWDKLEVGDLLFFGREATDIRSRAVTHVGMWIGNNQFIHSASNVHISSVDPSSEVYDEFNTNRYLEARRYLNNWNGNIIQTSVMYNALVEG